MGSEYAVSEDDFGFEGRCAMSQKRSRCARHHIAVAIVHKANEADIDDYEGLAARV
jgi:hypothetical protein